MRSFLYDTVLNVPAREVLEWHCRPGALERLTPPWETVSAAWTQGNVKEGGVVDLRIGKGLLSRHWRARHLPCELRAEGGTFWDEQVTGPMQHWRHEHDFSTVAGGDCRLRDQIEYQLPLHPLSAVAAPAVQRRLTRMFRFRHQRTAMDVQRHLQVGQGRALKVAITGSSGFIGTQLASFLVSGGHEVHRVVRAGVRRATTHGEIQWNPESGAIEAEKLEGLDAVIHLAGENVGSGRWNAQRKSRILQSRVEGTHLLASTLARLKKKPRVMLSSSAVGYYGDRGDAPLTESALPGNDFLAEVCQAWETAAAPARDAGIRVVHPRLGLVLGGAGGPLARLTPLFQWGLGGRLGSGRQQFPWVALDDVIGFLHFAMLREDVHGAFNVCAPGTVTNAEFTQTLSDVVRRPAVLAVPGFALTIGVGEFSQQLLGGQRPVPGKAQECGFHFIFPRLMEALRFELGHA